MNYGDRDVATGGERRVSDKLDSVDAWWRVANYLSAAQV